MVYFRRAGGICDIPAESRLADSASFSPSRDAGEYQAQWAQRSDRSDRVHRVATAGHATVGGADMAVRLVRISVQRRRRPYRALGDAYLLSLLLLLLTEGRFYYLAPAYPMLLAAGAVAIEKWT